VDLIPLEIQDFDVILGMNWLNTYHANVNCLTKVVSFWTLDDKEVEFKGKKNGVCRGLMSTLAARKLMSKKGEVYLTYRLCKGWGEGKNEHNFKHEHLHAFYHTIHFVQPFSYGRPFTKFCSFNLFIFLC
jgi:hypothetical protein